MTQEQQQIAIAKACGWKTETTQHLGPNRVWGEHPEPPHTYQKLPDYLNDLNAMHEAEKSIRNIQARWARYVTTLRARNKDGYDGAIHATAAQRAEAFLITENL